MADQIQPGRRTCPTCHGTCVCTRCYGTGDDPEDPEPCFGCDGDGRCEDCDGEGWKPVCPRCGGLGWYGVTEHPAIAPGGVRMVVCPHCDRSVSPEHGAVNLDASPKRE